MFIAGLVGVTRGARHEPGGAWQRVRLGVLPDGTTGWVPRSSLAELGVPATHLVVDRGRFRATFRGGVSVFSAPVGGKPQSPAHEGDFYGRDALTRYRSAISHGCIRVRHADIVRVAALMPVGRPVTVN